ncbi:hypothetical protein Bca4012_083875 [Brassica carinata]
MNRVLLQTYVQKRGWDVPLYVSERKGPDHALLFRSKVTVSGWTFQSAEWFPKLKAAENAAAKVALTTLEQSKPEASIVGIDVGISYKTLIQEIAQKNKYPLPVYTTTSSGPPHDCTFVSTVLFAGKTFKGEEATTKKMAEILAKSIPSDRIEREVLAILIPSDRIEREVLAIPIPSDRIERKILAKLVPSDRIEFLECWFHPIKILESFISLCVSFQVLKCFPSHTAVDQPSVSVYLIVSPTSSMTINVVNGVQPKLKLVTSVNPKLFRGMVKMAFVSSQSEFPLRFYEENKVTVLATSPWERTNITEATSPSGMATSPQGELTFVIL